MDEMNDVLGFEAHRCEAMIAADFAALDRLLSDALTWTHASARQDDKASFLAGLRGGHTRYLEIRRSEEPSVPMTMRHWPHASLNLGVGEQHRGYAQHSFAAGCRAWRRH